jgi:carbon storage regulator
MAGLGILVLTRKVGQSLVIGDAVVEINRVSGNRVILGIKAPRSVSVVRSELSSFEPENATANVTLRGALADLVHGAGLLRSLGRSSAADAILRVLEGVA